MHNFDIKTLGSENKVLREKLECQGILFSKTQTKLKGDIKALELKIGQMERDYEKS